MWFVPLLVLGVIAIAAASRSAGRDAMPPQHLLPPPSPPALAPPPPPGVSGDPGPISVLGEILRIGQTPPPMVVMSAIAEAESIGRPDLASDIVQAFVVPVVNAQQKSRPHERGTCAPRAQDYQRGTCAPTGSPRTQADSCAPRGSSGPSQSGPPAPAASASPQLTTRYATQDEILAMLHSDPSAFLKVMATGRAPVIEVPPAAPPAPPPAPPAPPPAAVAPPPPPVPAAVEAAAVDQVVAQLSQVPGFSGAGILLVDPSTGAEVFEVSWLRGYAIPTLPPEFLGRPVRVVVTDTLPVQQAVAQPAAQAEPQPAGLHPETVAQMQEAAGIPEAADQTRAIAPGSPIANIPDDAWRAFVVLLARESPQFDSSRHVGQYRQRRERLADLGIDPRAIWGSAVAQRAALDADLADAYRHAVDGGVVAEHLKRSIAVPGVDGTTMITLSGLLGVIQCAGLDGAVGWLERPNDRKRYPHTTQAFLRTNGRF